jgi:catechol 2,3-dioxygenase-like lactoylglutathione lyase family enzyme
MDKDIPPMEQSPRVNALDHLVLTVANIPDTCRFYQDVLGMQAEAFTVADGTRRWALEFGRQKINLHEVGSEFDPKSAHPTAGSADLCFLTSTPLENWIKHFSVHDIAILQGPIPRTGATGPIHSIYIRDPDENLIEVSVQKP